MTDLTDGEREVAILTVLGVQTESVDKSEPTIASQCNIEPRSVRYRQKRVAEKLAKYKE
jgi:DNA-binding CsgD family transcriptional regulator